MPRVGFERYLDADDEFAYRPLAGKPGTYLFFYPSAEQSRYSRHQTGLQHLGVHGADPLGGEGRPLRRRTNSPRGLAGGCCTSRRCFLDTRSRISRRSGSTSGASCSKRYAIRTATDHARRNPLCRSRSGRRFRYEVPQFSTDWCVKRLGSNGNAASVKSTGHQEASLSTLEQSRYLATAIPGPRSQELIDRKSAAVSRGVGTTMPVYAVQGVRRHRRRRRRQSAHRFGLGHRGDDDR